jgi:hypothetical protein
MEQTRIYIEFTITADNYTRYEEIIQEMENRLVAEAGVDMADIEVLEIPESDMVIQL